MIADFEHNYGAEAQRIIRDIDGGTLLHAYLVVGADEDINIDFCRSTAKYYLCRDFCGRCINCQKLSSGNHTAFELIQKDKIDVEMVKQLIYASNLQSEDAKFFVLSDAAAINHIAQNKLLKTLEEAPKSTYFFLCTSRPDMLLPTIRSRCAVIYIAPQPDDVILSALKAPPEIAALAVKYSAGSLSRAKKLCGGKRLIEAVRLIDSLPQRLKTSKDVLALSAELSGHRDNAQIVLDTLELVFVGMLTKPIEGYSPAAAAGAIDAVIDAKRKFASNCNFTSVIDRLLLKILEEKHNARSS